MGWREDTNNPPGTEPFKIISCTQAHPTLTCAEYDAWLDQLEAESEREDRSSGATQGLQRMLLDVQPEVEGLGEGAGARARQAQARSGPAIQQASE